MKWLIICILMIGIIVRFTTTIGNRDRERLKLAALQRELQEVWNEKQCYYEELIRIVIEYGIGEPVKGKQLSPDTTYIVVIGNAPQLIYTIPCNGRRVITR